MIHAYNELYLNTVMHNLGELFDKIEPNTHWWVRLFSFYLYLRKNIEKSVIIVAIKISENKYGYDVNNKILTVPFYYVPFLINTLQKGEINELINIDKKYN